MIKRAIIAEGVVDLKTGDGDGYMKGAFQFCSRLERVTLPDSLRRIGMYTFYNCHALVHVDIPSGVNELGVGAFAACESLQTVNIPEGVVILPDSLFGVCASLKSVKLPFSLKKIDDNVFHKNKSLQINTYNDDGALEGLTHLGKYAFWECDMFTAFKLPPSLKTLETRTFWKCKNLKRCELPPSLETIKSGAFEFCHPNLCIDLPETVINVEMRSLKGIRIRLPTSLSILTNGGFTRGLLHGVREVVISSRVQLWLLVAYIRSLPETYICRAENFPFLHPDLKFKVLYCGSSSSTATDSPPINKHIPEAFFSFSITPNDLISLQANKGDDALLTSVNSAFTSRISIYASLLRCKIAKPPEEILSIMLPFIYGDDLLSDAMLGDIVEMVKTITATTE